MLHSRVIIKLDPIETAALLELSRHEYREPPAQAAILIREALEARGLLTIHRAQPAPILLDIQQEMEDAQ